MDHIQAVEKRRRGEEFNFERKVTLEKLFTSY
jgi:hypothetical protein